jgi:hypothetical protein
VSGVVEKLPTLSIVFRDTWGLYEGMKLRGHGYFDACANLFTVRSVELPNQSIVSPKIVMVGIRTG